MKTLQARTDVRTRELKNLLKELILKERDQWLTVNELLAKLAKEKIELEYNRSIVERLLGEFKREGQVHCVNGKVFWVHRRQFCQRDDGTGHCKCCGTELVAELGGGNCEHC